MNLLLYIVLLINVIHAQIALPSFHGAQKPHTSVSSSGSQTFNYTGSQQTFTVPSGVSTITIKVWGGQGGSGGYYSSGSYCSTGGKGGYATGDLSVTAGNTVYVYVGGQGEGFASCNTYMQSHLRNLADGMVAVMVTVVHILVLAVAEHQIFVMVAHLLVIERL